MKLIFSFILLFSQTLWSRDIILIEHLQNIESANIVKKILESKFQIPSTLIKITSPSDKCSEKSEALLQLCVLKNGDMEIKKINKYVLENAFNIFWDKEGVL